MVTLFILFGREWAAPYVACGERGYAAWQPGSKTEKSRGSQHPPLGHVPMTYLPPNRLCLLKIPLHPKKYHQLGLSLYPVAFCGCLRPIPQWWSWEGEGGRRDSSHDNEMQLLWEETRRNQMLLFRAESRAEMFLMLMCSLIRLSFGIKHPKVIRL